MLTERENPQYTTYLGSFARLCCFTIPTLPYHAKLFSSSSCQISNLNSLSSPFLEDRGIGVCWESKVYPGVERRKAKPKSRGACVCTLAAAATPRDPPFLSTYSRLARLPYLRSWGPGQQRTVTMYLIPSSSSGSTQLL